MRPVDLLPAMPDDSVILHELGHLLVGLELGVEEGGIEFVTYACDEIARARYLGGQYVQAWQVAVRAFAGMYFQARLTQVLSPGFQSALLNGSLLAPIPGDIDARMDAEGCIGDWQGACGMAAQLSASPRKHQRLLRDALEETVAITEDRNLLPLANALLPRVKAWLTTDIPELLPGDLVIYSIGEPRQRWRDHTFQWAAPA